MVKMGFETYSNWVQGGGGRQLQRGRWRWRGRSLCHALSCCCCCLHILNEIQRVFRPLFLLLSFSVCFAVFRFVCSSSSFLFSFFSSFASCVCFMLQHFFCCCFSYLLCASTLALALASALAGGASKATCVWKSI